MKSQATQMQQIARASTIKLITKRVDVTPPSAFAADALSGAPGASPGASPIVFPIKGQGTVSVEVSVASGKAFDIVLTPEGVEQPALGLTIEQDWVTLWCDVDGVRIVLATKAQRGIGLNAPGVAQPYWLSLDTHNGRVRYGKGEMLRALMLFEHSWAVTGRTASNPLAFSSRLSCVRVVGAELRGAEVLPIPVTLDPAPHVVPPDAVTLERLERNEISVVQDLPPACQRLYANVAGPGITITPADFPEFPQAIQRSIVTPGALCFEKLKEKSPEFGYLRVTIDPNLGDSPGQPYVLEIWPAGRGSPVHDHGRACAVIKVLWGAISVEWFAALSPQIVTPWGTVTLEAGEVTFLSPDYYQIHRLHNPLPAGESFCATIQCYRYPDGDRTHYEYFDFVEKGEIRHFTPDSDWKYLEFKALIQKEWLAAQGRP